LIVDFGNGLGLLNWLVGWTSPGQPGRTQARMNPLLREVEIKGCPARIETIRVR